MGNLFYLWSEADILSLRNCHMEFETWVVCSGSCLTIFTDILMMMRNYKGNIRKLENELLHFCIFIILSGWGHIYFLTLTFNLGRWPHLWGQHTYIYGSRASQVHGGGQGHSHLRQLYQYKMAVDQQDNERPSLDRHLKHIPLNHLGNRTMPYLNPIYWIKGAQI